MFSAFLHQGIADSYCSISVGTQIERTAVADNNLNPIWKQTIIVAWDGEQSLFLEVFDFIPYGRDESLGFVEVNICV